MANQSMGSQISQARAKQGVSVRQLASWIGVRPATVENWEQDRSEPRANKLLILAGILNVPILRLLNDEKQPARVVIHREPDSDLRRVHQKLERAKALQNEISALLSETAAEVAELHARGKSEGGGVKAS